MFLNGKGLYFPRGFTTYPPQCGGCVFEFSLSATLIGINTRSLYTILIVRQNRYENLVNSYFLTFKILSYLHDSLKKEYTVGDSILFPIFYFPTMTPFKSIFNKIFQSRSYVFFSKIRFAS